MGRKEMGKRGNGGNGIRTLPGISSLPHFPHFLPDPPPRGHPLHYSIARTSGGATIDAGLVTAVTWTGSATW